MNEAMRPEPVELSTGMPRQLSVVVPTFNERDNVVALYRKLSAALKGIAWEAQLYRCTAAASLAECDVARRVLVEQRVEEQQPAF